MTRSSGLISFPKTSLAWGRNYTDLHKFFRFDACHGSQMGKLDQRHHGKLE
ncbi:hypothetical protein CLV48_11012 [Cecembia rubra]|uniref:Uncharacterized protein n=1 Tax=Cecembia rubra TaxID=1485585 RepID=A0A2P8DYC7_9BACT|nr:hypothetical protein CLV48_11012 [Cecembia rubra]